MTILTKLIGIQESEIEDIKSYAPDKSDRKKGIGSLIVKKW